MQFAKLYGTDDQVLVLLVETDNGMEVQVMFHHHDLGLCITRLNFNNEEGKGAENARATFDAMDETTARYMVDGLRADLRKDEPETIEGEAVEVSQQT